MNNAKKTRILLADDHQMILEGLKCIIHEDENLKVVATATDGCQAIKIIESQQIDFVITDVDMKPMDGVQLTKEIKQKHPDIKVLVITGLRPNEDMLVSFPES